MLSHIHMLYLCKLLDHGDEEVSWTAYISSSRLPNWTYENDIDLHVNLQNTKLLTHLFHYQGTHVQVSLGNRLIYYAPRLWNILPLRIRTFPILEVLQTHFFDFALATSIINCFSLLLPDRRKFMDSSQCCTDFMYATFNPLIWRQVIGFITSYTVWTGAHSALMWYV